MLRHPVTAASRQQVEEVPDRRVEIHHPMVGFDQGALGGVGVQDAALLVPREDTEPWQLPLDGELDPEVGSSPRPASCAIRSQAITGVGGSDGKPRALPPCPSPARRRRCKHSRGTICGECPKSGGARRRYCARQSPRRCSQSRAYCRKRSRLRARAPGATAIAQATCGVPSGLLAFRMQRNPTGRVVR